MKKFIAVFIISMVFSSGVKAENSFDFVLENTKYEDVLEGVLDIDIPAKVNLSTVSSNKELKEWTVMFYSNAKDRLRASQLTQLFEMKKIGSTDEVNIVAEAGMPIKYDDGMVSTMTFRMALGDGADHQYIDEQRTKFLKSDYGEYIDYSHLEPFKTDIVGQSKNEDMGDWRNIADFTKWAKTNYPAKRYIFIMFGHGEGFFDRKKIIPAKGISMDAETGNYVTLPEFSMLMEETGKVDALVMHSCLMQMAEVAYQVKDYADVIVGSGELMWAIGYDFKKMLEVLNSEPHISNEELGKLLANSYVERANFRGGHASVIKTSEFPVFIDKLNDWVDATMSVDHGESIIKGINDVIRFDVFGIAYSSSPAMARALSISGDLYDFVDIVSKNLSQNTPEEKLAYQKGQELMDYISNELIYAYAYQGKSFAGYDFSRAHGLAIHIPPMSMRFGTLEGFENNSETLYWDLPFARETKWGVFLKWVYEGK